MTRWHLLYRTRDGIPMTSPAMSWTCILRQVREHRHLNHRCVLQVRRVSS